ncbi:MAG: histidine kinase [Clostridia bacterium]|nr:histidine kinase [Clostridia bacterium]
MGNLLSLRVLLLSFSIILLLVLLLFSYFKGKRSPLLFTFLWFQSMGLLWLVLEFVEIFVPNAEARWVNIQIKYFSLSFIGLAWLVFAFCYTENQTILKRKRIIAFLFIPPCLMYALLLTNNWHRLFFTHFGLKNNEIQNGVFFWLHQGMTYSYVLGGTILILGYSFKALYYARRNMIVILACIIPVFVNVIFNSSKKFDPGFDPTPLAFPVSLTLVAVATFKYRFLNIMPFALREIYQNVVEAMIVVDKMNKIIDCNQAFLNEFPEYSALKDRENMVSLIKLLKVKSEHSIEVYNLFDAILNESCKNITAELKLKGPKDRYYLVNIRPLFDKRKEANGRIICFNDITKYKELLGEINEKNTELSSMNQDLQETNERLVGYLDTVEELAVLKERNRLAREIHDTLGHTLTVITSLMEVGRIECERNNAAHASKKLKEAIEISREGLRELRVSIEGLVEDKSKYEDLIEALGRLAEFSTKSGIDVEFSLYGEEYYKKISVGSWLGNISDTIYKICKESITNSLKHGNAKKVDIVLRFNEDKIKLLIVDNGKGCKVIQKGFGLSGMEERVKNLQGTVTFGSDTENGFNIYIEIPVQGSF